MKVWRSYKMEKEIEDRYSIKYRIDSVGSSSCWHRPEKDMPLISIGFYGLEVGSEGFGRAEIGHSGYQWVHIYMTKEMANAQGIEWDGTKEGVDKIKKDLEGTIHELSLGLQQ